MKPKKINPYKNILHLLILFVLMLLAIHMKAQGNLLLYPKRVVFEGPKRFQVINLANTGKDTVRYLISVMQLRMTEAGNLEMITQPDPGQQFADKYFRFYPRNVILAPNEAQTVKVQLINTNDLQPGEYRSHIYFRAEPDKKPLGEKESRKDSNGIAVNVVAVFGISIPVIIRKGDNDTKVDFSGASIEMNNDSMPSLKFDLHRIGNMSVYADITVDQITEDGKTTQVATAKGVGVYTPNTTRHFNLLLDKNALNYHKGKLRIRYTTQADAGSIKIAEKELSLL